MSDIQVSKQELFKIYRDIIYGVLIKKQKRDKKRVSNDYHLVYQNLKDSKLWNLELDDILRIDFSNIGQENNKILYENKHMLVRNFRNTIWENMQNEFIKKISRFIESDDEIIELGCGYGRFLFTLRKHGFKNKMSGYDISPIGIDVAKQINQKFELDIDFGVFDYTKKIETDLKGKTVFTYGSLEQVKHSLEKAIINIINGHPKQVIHFETIPQILDNSLYKLMIIMNRYRKDYPLNILNILQRNQVKISHLEEMDICSSVLNPLMLVRYTV